MIKLIAATISILVLAGCSVTDLGVRGIQVQKETLDAIGNARREIVQRRVELRAQERKAEDTVIDMHLANAQRRAAMGDVEGAEAAAQKAIEAIEAANPSLVKLIEEIDRVNEAIEAARED